MGGKGACYRKCCVMERKERGNRVGERSVWGRSEAEGCVCLCVCVCVYVYENNGFEGREVCEGGGFLKLKSTRPILRVEK